jgi:hypothetical protein
MIRSHVVEIDGTFVGAAVPQHDGRLRFVAVDIRLDDLDGSTWPNLSEIRRVARSLLKTGLRRLDAGAASAPRPHIA